MDPDQSYSNIGIPNVNREHKYNDKYIYFIFQLTVKETEEPLNKTYTAPEYSGYARIGLFSPPVLGFQFGNTYGFVHYSNFLNVHLYGEWGVGLGMGVSEFNFDSFSDFFSNFGLGIPIHVGGAIEFDIKKFGLGLGGGYLLTPLLPPGIYGTYYTQVVINRFFYVDYYFTPGQMFVPSPKIRQEFAEELKEYNQREKPLYYNFGMGIKTRF